MLIKKRIFFAGGGTGGHVFPGVSIAEQLKELNPSIEIFWLGQKNSIEEKIIKDIEYIKFIHIPSGKLRRYFSLENFADIFKIIVGIIKTQ